MEYPVLLLKLASGEEVVSKVLEEGSTMVLIQPRQFILQDDGRGGVRGGFVEFMPIAKASYINLVQRPIAIAELTDEMVDAYLKIIGDKVIQTPPSGIIVP
jgi:hypothetical protein